MPEPVSVRCSVGAHPLLAGRTVVVVFSDHSVDVLVLGPVQVRTERGLVRLSPLGRLAWLDQALEAHGGAQPVLLCGPGGVGKTALAVHWAHRVRDRFADGQLYLDLRGFDRADPLTPMDAVDALLQMLDRQPDRGFTSLDRASAALRGALAGRRMVLLLDNAATAEQVRPLLPGEPGCVTLVTSRNRLSGLVALDAAVRRHLAPLSAAEAFDLLVRLVGPDRVRDEAQAADETLARCGRLPLAIGIAAARMLDSPELRIADYRDALSGEQGLDALSVPGDADAAFRTVLWTSYRRLPVSQRRVLLLFGTAPIVHLTAAATAAAMEQPVPDAERLLEALVQVSLLEPPRGGRYASHDLIRWYARDLSGLASAHDERTATLRRLIEHFAGLADAADAALRPNVERASRVPVFSDEQSAMDWFDHEYANLGALIIAAEDRGWHRKMMSLILPTRGYLRRLFRLAEWERIFEIGLSAAHATKDPALIAHAYDGLADRHFQAREHVKARDAWVAATAAFRDAGNEFRWALSHDNVGMMELELGNPVTAERHHLEALQSASLAAKPHATVSIHIHLGLVYGSTHRWPECQAALENAYVLAVAAANPELACYALHNLAEMFRQIGDADSARARAGEVIELATRTRLPVRVARAHHFLFDLLAPEDRALAEKHRTAALEIYERLGHPAAAELHR